MTAQILDGKALAKKIRNDIAARVVTEKLTPGLAVVLIGSDAASQVYVGKKRKACEEVGFYSEAHDLPDNTTQADLLKLIQSLNANDKIHGILVQLPLPDHIDVNAVIDAINPRKDVDGFHPHNLGLLTQRRPGLRPCTPHGVMKLLASTGVEIRGLHATVVGASNIVGRPMALELLMAGTTTTVCHRYTQDLAKHVAEADILIVAIGKPGIVKSEWLKPGAMVVDVGINRLDDGSLCGDVDFDSAKDIAGWITPVPGGVGPMTVAMLLQNTLLAAQS